MLSLQVAIQKRIEDTHDVKTIASCLSEWMLACLFKFFSVIFETLQNEAGILLNCDVNAKPFMNAKADRVRLQILGTNYTWSE